MTEFDLQRAYENAAELLTQTDGIVITAGAGIGVDSGLPDFRGNTGFWNAYPELGRRGLSFSEIASPRMFKSAPRLAWGFYGHRLNLYRSTVPHQGFAMLQEIAASIPFGARIFTSNVDGQFQKAGFPSEYVTECHGSIHVLQCLNQCGEPVWSAAGIEPEIDEPRCELVSEIPCCPNCGGVARPNILMFGDWAWDETRTIVQESRLKTWLAKLRQPTVIELGAGTAIPTVRLFGAELNCPMIRINPTDATVGLARNIAIESGALKGIAGIVEAWRAASL